MKTTKSHIATGILSMPLKLALLVLLVPGLAYGQGQQGRAPAKAPAPSGATAARTRDIIKVVHVKYANVDRLARLLGFFPIAMKADSGLKVITLGGTPARVAAVEEAIKRLDVPPPPAQNIHVTAYLLMATRRPPGDTSFSGSTLPPGRSGAQLPEELREVVKQLRGVMEYHSFRLVHTLTLVTSNHGHASVSGVTPIATGHARDPNVPPIVEMAKILFSVGQAEAIAQEKLDSVMLRGMSLSLTLGKSPVASFLTDVEVGAKQRVVVGKTDVLNPDLGLFLVLSAKVTN